MHTNIIADPDAVVVEVVSAPVTSLAMLRILENMRITHIAIE